MNRTAEANPLLARASKARMARLLPRAPSCEGTVGPESDPDPQSLLCPVFVPSAALQAEAVPALCALLEEEEFDVDTEVAGILAALSRDDKGRGRMLEAGAVVALAELMETGATQCSKEYAVTALLQLAAKCRACLESIFRADVFLPLDMLTRSESLETQVKARALLAFLREWEAAHCPQGA